MKYCSKCGNELTDEAVVCPKCGCQTAQGNPTVQGNPNDYNPNNIAYNPNTVTVGGPSGNSKTKSFNKKILIIGAAAIAVIVVVVILITTLSSTPTRTANKYLKAYINTDGEQMLDTMFPDIENCVKTLYDEDNKDLFEDSGYDDADEYYEELEEDAKEEGYDGNIESGSDVYDCCVWLLSESLKDEVSDEDIKDFKVKDVKQYKEGDDEYDDFIDGDIDYILDDDYFDCDFDFEKDDIKQYAVVEYELLDDDGEKVIEDDLELVKVGTKWYAFDVDAVEQYLT